MLRAGSIKTFLQNACLGIAAIVIFCLAIELTFRIIHGAPLKTYGQQIAKETSGPARHVLLENLDRNFAGVRIFTNSVGLRDYRQPHKAETGTQILIIGDSFTFGYGVALEESFPYILEKLLNANSDKNMFEVINAGVPGYDTAQELDLLRRIMPYYSPKWIVVAFHPSDLLNPQSPNNSSEDSRLKRASDEGAHEGINWTFKLREGLRYNSAFFSWFYKFYKINLIQYVPPPRGFLVMDPDKFSDSPQFALTTKALQEIQGIAIRNNARMAIFMVVSPMNWKAYPYLKLHGAINRFCKQNGIYFIDPFQEFSKYNPGDLWVAPNDGHYNRRANEIAARSIFKLLQGIEE